ncbi:MAG: amino acid/amide transporter rane protein 2, family [Frankiales bacterium]|nr:amino acid/amide transporter rane protein 2, family [Frankiales bacterium]
MTAVAAHAAPFRLTGSGVAARGLAYVGLAVVLFLPWFTTDFSKTCSLAVIYALMGLSLNIVVGYTGQLSLGHQGFLGLGALVTANVVFKTGLPIWLAMAAAVLATTLVALALGLVALRITGLYLSLITLVFGSAITSSLFALATFTDNNSGVKITRPSYLSGNGDWYLVCLAVLLVVFYLDYRLTISKIGRALLALKENERVAEAFGIGVTSYKLLAFALSGAIAGLAGGLYTFRGELYSEKDFQDPNGFTLALLFVVMCVVGGLGNRLGVVVAGLFFGLINEMLDGLLYLHWVRDVVKHIPVLNGYYDSDVKASYLASLIGALLLLQTLIFNPGGLGASLRPVARWMTGHRFELHDTTASGPAAVEGSSVRA